MKLKPVEASLLPKIGPELKELLTLSGSVFANDALLPIWQKDYDILLLYGGRGGGKSEAICDKLLDECLNDDYFKCYYGRKVFDTVRGSCFATLVYCIKKNKLEHLFKFSEADTSSMIITCLKNGNKFHPFGSDKADKLKSIKDPTHIWCEEFDQFEFADFRELYPTLRTPRGANRFIGSFNTHGVYPNHWLLKIFFPERYEGNDKQDVQAIDILKGRRVEKLFVNFTDNYFIDQVAYRQTLWLSAAGNVTTFNGIANGDWGIMVNDSPWLFAFSRDKHLAKTEIFAERAENLYLSFDFNRNPHACTVMQWPRKAKLKVIEVIKEANVGTEGICDIILKKYPGYLYTVTGDYSGDTASSIFKEHITNYTMIKAKLGLTDGQVQITPNPRLEKNRTLVNAVFHQYPVEVCPVKARPFLFDAENVKSRADGTIVKDDRDDPSMQADVLDTVRYWINKFMPWFIAAVEKAVASKQPLPDSTAAQKAIAAIERGDYVTCTKYEYDSLVRKAIHGHASYWLEQHEVDKAKLALSEVDRLDRVFL